jgi:RNA polymerase-binding transcription factor DksA
MTTDVLFGRSTLASNDSIVAVAAASLSPRAVLNGQWTHQLNLVTELSTQLHDSATSEADRSALEATIARARREMGTIEAALERLVHRTYGRCETCGGPIDPLRLAGLPTTHTCRRCAAAAP